MGFLFVCLFGIFFCHFSSAEEIREKSTEFTREIHSKNPERIMLCSSVELLFLAPLSPLFAAAFGEVGDAGSSSFSL